MGAPVDSVGSAGLRGWTPVRVRGSGAVPLVDWAVIDAAFTESFFEQSVHRAMQHPFNQVFARQTPLDVLDALAEREPAIEPAGFVFHMSRCGSTVIAQMLAQLSSAVVLSEPQPVDGVLRLRRAGAFDDATAARRLRAMLGAMAGSSAQERRVFVKFHAWHVFDLPFIARTFPKTPWIFAFREPRAVLRSQEKAPGAEIVPFTIDPRLAGIDPAAVASVSPTEYCARMLAAFCRAALEHAAGGHALFVDYETLPEGVLSSVMPFFGISPDANELLRMREIAEIDAKGQGDAFRSRDGPPKPSEEIERLASRWLEPVYAALRDIRPSTSSG